MKVDNLTTAITRAEQAAKFAENWLCFGSTGPAQLQLEEAKANIRWAEEIIRRRARRAKKGRRS
jgi:hypothetical protein